MAEETTPGDAMEGTPVEVPQEEPKPKEGTMEHEASKVYVNNGGGGERDSNMALLAALLGKDRQPAGDNIALMASLFGRDRDNRDHGCCDNHVTRDDLILTKVHDVEGRLSSSLSEARGDIKNRIDDARAGLADRITETRANLSDRLADVRGDLKTNVLETREILRSQMVESEKDILSAIARASEVNVLQHGITREKIDTLERERVNRLLSEARNELSDLRNEHRGDRRARDLEVNISQSQQVTQQQAQFQSQIHGLECRMRDLIGEFQVARATNMAVNVGGTQLAGQSATNNQARV